MNSSLFRTAAGVAGCEVMSAFAFKQVATKLRFSLRSFRNVPTRGVGVMRGTAILVSVVIGIVCLMVPQTAAAQSVFTGVVRDTTGAVLPGVTLEATSPALIEKSRTVITDERGSFRV